MLCCRAA